MNLEVNDTKEEECNNEENVVANGIKPFEWLTNFSSLVPFLRKEFLFGKDGENGNEESKRSALHVGCGSSSLGEGLLQHLGYEFVLNIDKDEETLMKMKERWERKEKEKESIECDCKKRMEWKYVDFVEDQIDEKGQYFDLIVDKSTLDCALCSEDGVAGLLCYVYQKLNPIHGVYVVVSFHPVEMLLPLLQNCPSANWSVQHSVIAKQIDDKDELPEQLSLASNNHLDHPHPSSLPSSSTVNVLVCRRQSTSSLLTTDECDNMLSTALHNQHHRLNRIDVRKHIHHVNDEWFQTQHPLLTRMREEEIYQKFGDATTTLDLTKCYMILFTDAEREHLTMEHFLEDWHAFIDTGTMPNNTKKINPNGMTYDTAIDFLREMQ